MGFCTLCNQNYYSSVACPKCHRSLSSDNSSRITSLFANRKGLSNNNSTDKWQDTYSKKGIFSNNPMPSYSTPRPRQSSQRMTMPKFTREEKDDKSKENSNLKSCAYCHKKQNSWSDFNHFTIYKSVYYCKPCLEEKLDCPKCHVKVKLLDSQVDYNNHVWHTNCFQCHYCSSQLKEALAAQDSEGNPCCRSCHVSRKQPSPESVSASTPLLSSSKSALTSAYFTRRGRPLSALVNHVIEDGANSIKQVLEDKPAEQKSPKAYTNAAEKLKQIVEPTNKQTAKAASTITPSQDTLEPKKTQRRKKLVVKKPCKECGQHVSKKDYRGLKTITGEVLCYHAYCLFCAKCHQSFTDLEFCTDGKHFYHTKCPETMMNRANNNTSPQSEEEEPFPKTPTFPSADTHFDVLSSSPTNLDLLPIRQENDDLTKKSNTMVEITCNTCSRPVTDTFLELANHFYHKECLLCAGCQKTVPTNRKLFKYQDKLYCDSCSVKNNLELKKKKETVNSDLRVTLNHDIIKKSNSTSPSDIFKSRKKSLPRLGGVRTCARCNESMPFLDTHPGPNATRWHKKCLRCSGCNKQMDSDAHMTINESTGLCLVHCRECLDDTPKPKFVR
ncbi:hypothetical protein G6F57_002955 [Rhizopus arrhizus]|uniref:LIM zinc-binding domain-containing protein n=1 Tax=Rhizopus oryzae TaxID=64495 RepID=A0A9P6XE41_RHIOR|nr:hypothetical protein G6F30_005072 [Rhizopus arrhizus]KAG1406855.1 hypothetical protein G6F58_009754 [Rhizopus delemar]KAG0983584.1 hypothetical protein G6F29_005418 [Rhizopus arrhizus]KAG0996552.1 hypothetical protein G6F28_003737 [Rhizopus arrhizus]KAG1009575.1 hypothetical protein G6F27_005458 [Rhizopus arrhizus]